jgi:hypothetical protein
MALLDIVGGYALISDKPRYGIIYNWDKNGIYDGIILKAVGRL